MKKEYEFTLPLTPNVKVTLKVTWSLYDFKVTWATQITDQIVAQSNEK